MGRLFEKIRLKEDAVMQWHKKAGNITTNLKVKVYLTLPALSATNTVMWNCYVDGSNKGRYDMILGRDLSKELGLNLKLSEHVTKADYGPLGKYIFGMLNIENITSEE